MGVQKITFDESSVSAKIDADIYHFLLSHEVGIFKNFKSSVSFTLANNIITFRDGYVSIYGRLLYIENNTQVSITTDAARYGFVVLGINTTNNSATIYTKENASSYPSLTTTNLLNSDGLYELVLCAYTKTTSAVTLNNSYERLFITNHKDQISTLRSEMISRFYPRTHTPSLISSGVYRLGNLNSQILERSIVQVIIAGKTVVTFPGAQIFILVGSNASVNYRHNASDYTMHLFYENGNLTFTCGSTSHTINKVILTTL